MRTRDPVRRGAIRRIREQVILLSFLVLPQLVLAQVSGHVREATTQAPLAGAIVTVQATTQRAITAADGSFQLPAVSGAVVIAGAHKGYFNGGVSLLAPATGVEILLDPVPIGSSASYQLFEPSECGICHPAQYDEWLGSPMAEAGFNRWVYDIYDGSGTTGGLGGFVYTRDSVFADSNPASECAACHEPEIWVDDPHGPLLPLASGDPRLVHGVSCEVCHKIAHVDESHMNSPGLYPGFVTFNRPDPLTGQQVQYGLLGDSTAHIAGVMRGSYQPQLAAAACGACHQDKNDPDEDGVFEEPNGVISEPTYLEWLASPYGDPQSPLYASCVECHMPPTGATSVSPITFPPLVRAPGTVRSHDIRGTTPEFLENAVSLQLDAQAFGDDLLVTVTITNDGTGHHVPTGVTVRNMILLVEASSSLTGHELPRDHGPTVHELGGIGDAAQGYYAGLPGKLYAKVNHDASGSGPTFFTDATGISFDSRLPALANDVTEYGFVLPAAGGPVEVRARLIYRRAWRALVDAKGWMVDGHDQPLADVQAPHFGHLMEEATASVNLPHSGELFRRGDVNGDGSIALSDPVALLEYLFVPGTAGIPCEDAADGNDSGRIDLADAVFLVTAVALPASPQPPAPGPQLCGTDPGADGLACDFYPAPACP